MHPTRNDIPESARRKIVELLDARLADALDLHTQLKHAHWNVRGPAFIAIHELFDKVHDAVEEYVDDLAERAVQLGGTAHGTARSVAKRSTLPEYGAGEQASEKDHLAAVASGLAAFGKATRASIDLSDELGDAVTADLFTEIAGGADKWLWFVEAHL